MSLNNEVNSKVTFLLIYLTFFLDNVLLTVVVPMMWSWVHPAVAGPPAAAGNHTLYAEDTSGRYGAAAGVVLGAKAGVQVASCGAAAAAVRAAGPRAALRAATALLAAAALVFAACGGVRAGGAGCAGCALAGRVVHGGGAALAAVAGLALAAAAPRTLAPLLSAVALGAVVGYTCGGAAGEAGGRRVPFLLLAIALLIDLALQFKYLTNDNEYLECGGGAAGGGGVRAAGRGGRAAAAAVFASTCVVATLEPCLPTFLHDQVHAQSGWSSFVFVADSVGYLVATMGAGAGGGVPGANARGAAVAGLLTVASVAALMPLATQLWMVCVLQGALGVGIGVTDAALFPAIIAPTADGLLVGDAPPHEERGGRDAGGPAGAAGDRAALLHAAASAAYAIGPVVGGLAAWACGLGAALRVLAAANAAAALALARVPVQSEIQEQTRLVLAAAR